MDYVKTNGIGLMKDYPYKGTKNTKCYKDVQKVPTEGRRLQIVTAGLNLLKDWLNKANNGDDKDDGDQKGK